MHRKKKPGPKPRKRAAQERTQAPVQITVPQVRLKEMPPALAGIPLKKVHLRALVDIHLQAANNSTDEGFIKFAREAASYFQAVIDVMDHHR